MNEVLTFVSRTLADDGYTVVGEARREVLCRLASISQTEFYQAQATDLRPELKFILADHLDYEGEYLCIYNGEWYCVLRTFRAGWSLEIVVQKASPEEVDPDGETDY